MSEALLSVSGLRAGYGSGLVLRDVDLQVQRSSVVGLVGRNGMGKTTLMRTLMGMLRPVAGRIALNGTELVGRPSHQIWHAGIALVPQGRRIFAGLTVAENFGVTSARPGRWSLEDVYELFPRLKERWNVNGAALSGGEQQMLAIGRALLGNPDLLLLDEPTEGLAPSVVQEVGNVVASLRDNGQAILLVEQNLDLVLRVASTIGVMEKGTITSWSSVADGAANKNSLRAAIGVAGGLAE